MDGITPWTVRPKPPSIDLADFVAIRIVVQAALATLAAQMETAGGMPPQQWLNHISACCQEAVVASTLTDGIDGDTFRTRIVEQMNHLLAGVRFPEPAPLDS